MTYEVRLAAGCYAGNAAPVISKRRSAEAAIKAARKSNRLEAYDPNGRCIAKWVAGDSGITRDGRTKGVGAGRFIG